MHSIALIGFPMDLGAGRRGVDMGPSALRIAGIAERLRELGYAVLDRGDIAIHTQEVQDIYDPRLKYLPEIARACRLLSEVVWHLLTEGHTPLALGGDHSMSIGSVAGVARWCRHHGKRLGILWIDAHGDLNTPESTPSGNIHGMPLAVILGYGTPELTTLAGFHPMAECADVVLLGVRSLDPGERELIRTTGLRVYTMQDIDRRGIYPIALEALQYLRQRVDHLHVSFDVDVLDPSVAAGVGTPVPGGLSYREAHLLMETIAESGGAHSLDVVEVNPILDTRNTSAVVAAELIASLMGKRIL
ncbi:Arginase [bacterium HR21]|nr:Arginase [bacterium HR21]